MIIKVTQEHIDKGCRESGSNCPVALAIKEQFNLEGVYVYSFGVAKTERGEVRLPFPIEVQKKILKFDREGTMSPFEFILEDF